MSLDFNPFLGVKMALRCSALAGLYRGNGDAVPLERSGGVRPSSIALSRGGGVTLGSRRHFCMAFQESKMFDLALCHRFAVWWLHLVFFIKLSALWALEEHKNFYFASSN